MGSVLLIIAIAFALTKLPKIQHKETGRNKNQNILHAFKHKHLAWLVIAQFFYVGAQVCVFSLFVLYATDEKEIATLEGIAGCMDINKESIFDTRPWKIYFYG